MSFGTGHHETTHMMVQHLLALDLKNKKVLDMGCGTGILAIFAEMKGAQPTDAIDIDSLCCQNSLENVQRNGCKYITRRRLFFHLMVNFDIDVASKFPSEAYTFPLLALIVNGFLVSSLDILMYLSPCKY